MEKPTTEEKVVETTTSSSKRISIPLEEWEKGSSNVKALLKDVPNFEGRPFTVIGKGISRKGNPWLLVEVQGVDVPIVFPMGNLTAWDRLSEKTEFPIFKLDGEDVVVNNDNVQQWLLDNDGGNSSIALK